ncbi:RHS repeat domain-containing protein [Streptomyces albogriseolus]|uniref:RHS repeat domain-containing protein n=1 Tax=Streptomyces albogriseolus TaxID=1887 RepID=UPI0037ADEED2
MQYSPLFNRPIKVTAPDTGSTTFTYNTAGLLESSTDANTHTSTYGYNAEGQPTSVKNPRASGAGRVGSTRPAGRRREWRRDRQMSMTR